MTQTVEKGSSLLSLLREEHALTSPDHGEENAWEHQAPGFLSEEGNRTSWFDGKRD